MKIIYKNYAIESEPYAKAHYSVHKLGLTEKGKAKDIILAHGVKLERACEIIMLSQVDDKEDHQELDTFLSNYIEARDTLMKELLPIRK